MPRPPKPLKYQHRPETLVRSKLKALRVLTTEQIVASLKPGAANPLTVKADGTIMEGNHRIFVLRERDVEVDTLPRTPYK